MGQSEAMDYINLSILRNLSWQIRSAISLYKCLFFFCVHHNAMLRSDVVYSQSSRLWNNIHLSRTCSGWWEERLTPVEWLWWPSWRSCSSAPSPSSGRELLYSSLINFFTVPLLSGVEAISRPSTTPTCSTGATSSFCYFTPPSSGSGSASSVRDNLFCTSTVL